MQLARSRPSLWTTRLLSLNWQLCLPRQQRFILADLRVKNKTAIRKIVLGSDHLFLLAEVLNTNLTMAKCY